MTAGKLIWPSDVVGVIIGCKIFRGSSLLGIQRYYADVCVSVSVRGPFCGQQQPCDEG